MFIPRHPVVENQFCSYGDQQVTGSAGVGGVVAYAGSVVALHPGATNQEPIVYKMVHGGTAAPFGFLMQKVKTGYHQVHPTGYFMPGDFGSSDVLAQPDYNTNGTIRGTKAVPVGVAHLGIWDTVHYTSAGGAAAATALTPGQALYPAVDSSKVTNSATNSSAPGDVAGERVLFNAGAPPQVAVVVKGASAAKASANINNTTLYPIRMKILI